LPCSTSLRVAAADVSDITTLVAFVAVRDFLD